MPLEGQAWRTAPDGEQAQAMAARPAEDVCIRSALPLQRPHDSKHALSADGTTSRQGRASLRGC